MDNCSAWFSHIFSVATAGSSFALVSGSGAASLPSVSTATSSTNKSRQHLCLQRLKPFSGGVSPEKETEKPERTGADVRRLQPLSLLLATDRTLAQRTLIVLLHVVNINSIPLAVIRAQLRQQWCIAPITRGVLCSAFIHNNNNGVMELNDPRSFSG